MDRFDDDALFAELRELRPTPRPEFTAELDQRAAAGFPRRSTRSAAAMPFVRLGDRWRALTPRRRLMPVLAVALAALVVATTVVAISQRGSSHREIAENSKIRSIPVEGAEGESEALEKTFHAKVPRAKPEAKSGEKCARGTAGCSSNGEFSGNFFGENGSKGAAKSGAEIEVEGGEHIHEVEAAAAAVPPTAPPATGHRDIERSAYVVLGTKPGEVASTATKVYEAVHAADGVVLHSSVQSGKAGATGATFALLIPSAKLDDALAAFSSIAEVRERHDATNDITAPTVSATEELRDSNAAIEGLLKELGDVGTEAERESVEARLREERRHHAAIRASLEHLHTRASMSEVSVRIVTDDGAGVVPASKESGNWGIGDALHDAGHILTIAAGVLLIALAVLTPIALITLLVWLANRFRVRRLRERTLG